MLKIFLIIILTQFITITNYCQDFYDLDISNKKVSIITQDSNIDTFLVFRSHILSEDISSFSPVLGTYQRTSSVYSFSPLVPFINGNKYTLWINGETLHYFTVGIPEEYNYLKIDKLFPSSQQIPANILQWHIIFNKPILASEVYDHIFFTNSEGDLVDQVIYRLDKPIFDSLTSRLTILSEPHNITEHVTTNSGFTVGETYTIHISNGLKDTREVPMEESWSSTFTIIPPDLTSPQIKNWKVVNPIENTLLPVVIQTRDMLDMISTMHCIEIYNRQTLDKVNGILSLENEESEIIFTPHLPWEKGEYEIRIYHKLSDVAGNKYDKLFDENILALTRSDRYSEKGEHTSLYFEIK